MPYSINKYDGITITTVEDGTINNTLDLKLVGKDYPGYGEIQNENFVFLLENFAGVSQPARPMNGQLWYDATARKIKVYDKLGQKWRSTGGAEIFDSGPNLNNFPTGLGVGDFAWDTRESKLYVSTGPTSALVHVGPQSVYDKGFTQMRSRAIYDGYNNIYAAIESYASGNIINIISSDEFTLHPDLVSEYGSRFSKIRKGLNLAYTNSDGVSTVTDTRYWGTASDSDRLGGLLPSAYVKAGAEATFPDTGFTVGDDKDLKIFIQNGNIPIIYNQLGDELRFYVKYNSQSVGPIVLKGDKIQPEINNYFDIGTTSLKYKTIYAGTFNGIATNAATVQVGATYQSGSITATPNTVAARDGSGNLTANVFNGVATSARYADLAEKYIPDADYEIGTVMIVGGEKEITASQSVGQRAIGVISGNPAYMMNSELENGVYVALKGRVPVKVFGPVKKGNRLVASSNGVATACIDNYYDVFAIALESSDENGVVIIEAIIL